MCGKLAQLAAAYACPEAFEAAEYGVSAAAAAAAAAALLLMQVPLRVLWRVL
jgi:hypothetical protein